MDSIRLSWWSTISRTLDALGNDTIDVVFDTWVSRSAATVAGDRAALSRIMPIVASTVRIVVLYIDVEHGLVHQLSQLRRLLWFHLQGDHPSEAEVDARF